MKKVYPGLIVISLLFCAMLATPALATYSQVSTGTGWHPWNAEADKPMEARVRFTNPNWELAFFNNDTASPVAGTTGEVPFVSGTPYPFTLTYAGGAYTLTINGVSVDMTDVENPDFSGTDFAYQRVGLQLKGGDETGAAGFENTTVVTNLSVNGSTIGTGTYAAEDGNAGINTSENAWLISAPTHRQLTTFKT